MVENKCMKFETIVKSVITIIPLLSSLNTASWWNKQWHYRLPITISAPSNTFIDRTMVMEIDFDQILEDIDDKVKIDISSIHVVEVNASGDIVNENVPYQFDETVEFQQSNHSRHGELVWFMSGKLAKGANRYFHCYFNNTNPDPEMNNFEPLVKIEEEDILWPVGDEEAQESIHFINLQGHYYFHRLGGSFASVIDKDELDWVSWKGNGGWGGNYRGLPNSWGPYHPGYTDCTTDIIKEGPIRCRIDVNNGTFVWDIYPNYIRATRLKGDQKDWWYEGTPGGEVDENDSYYVSNGVDRLFSEERFQEEIDEHWVVYKDGVVQRSLFLESHPLPFKIKLGDHTKTGPNTMVVTRFNLPDEPNPMYFTMGFIESKDNSLCTDYVHTVYYDPEISMGTIEKEGTVSAQSRGVSEITSFHHNRHSLIFVTPDNNGRPLNNREIYTIRGRKILSHQLLNKTPKAPWGIRILKMEPNHTK